MLRDTLGFIIRNFASFLILLLLVRFYMQTARIPFNQGLGQFVLKLTNFIVLPARRIIPSIAGLDTACLLLAWLIALCMHWALLALTPWPIHFLAPTSLLTMMLLALLEILRSSLYLLFAVVIGLAILSWVTPRSPLIPLLARLSEPFLRPLRRMIPSIGGVDISPLLLIFLVQLIQSVLVSRLETKILQLLFI
jgi:YggT family protein